MSKLDTSDWVGWKLLPLCSCCPEDYDVYYNSEQVGYIRNRYNTLIVRYERYGQRKYLYEEPCALTLTEYDKKKAILAIKKEMESDELEEITFTVADKN